MPLLLSRIACYPAKSRDPTLTPFSLLFAERIFGALFFRDINMGKKGGQHEMQAKGFSFTPRLETIFFRKGARNF